MLKEKKKKKKETSIRHHANKAVAARAKEEEEAQEEKVEFGGNRQSSFVFAKKFPLLISRRSRQRKRRRINAHIYTHRQTEKSNQHHALPIFAAHKASKIEHFHQNRRHSSDFVLVAKIFFVVSMRTCV